MPGLTCHFHTAEWCSGARLADGSYSYTCERADHPHGGPWTWLVVPPPPHVPGLAGLAEELGLDVELPAALAALGEGWFEYGLVEREYARRQPDGFRRMVERWGHTAIAHMPYTASAYLGGTLGRLSATGALAYHPGYGTGRWSYNGDISWWSTLPAGPWERRTSWAEVVGDAPGALLTAADVCRTYVPGSGT